VIQLLLAVTLQALPIKPEQQHIARNGLAAINTETGAVLDWTCNLNANQTVKSILLDKSGSSLYIGGDFTTIGGVNKTNLAKISTAGVVDAGFTTPNINASVGDQGGTCMVLNKGGDTLFMTGNFTDINGNARKNLAAVKTSDGSLTDFNPADFYLQAATCRFILLSKDGYSLYLGSNTNGLNMKSVNIATGTDVGEFDFRLTADLLHAVRYREIIYISAELLQQLWVIQIFKDWQR
jgi:hypothetical protein